MPDANGRIRGITVPAIPWHKEPAEDPTDLPSRLGDSPCVIAGRCTLATPPCSDCPAVNPKAS